MLREEAVLAKAQNLIDEHLEVEDLNLLKTRQPIRHDRRLVIWRYQMQMTSQKIGGYLRQNEFTVGMITRGVQKVTTFLDDSISSCNLTEEEWNTVSAASIGSNLA